MVNKHEKLFMENFSKKINSNFTFSDFKDKINVSQYFSVDEEKTTMSKKFNFAIILKVVSPCLIALMFVISVLIYNYNISQPKRWWEIVYTEAQMEEYIDREINLPWDQKNNLQKYPQFEFENSLYSCFNINAQKIVDNRVIGEFLQEINVLGYDEKENRYYESAVNVYKINSINSDNLVAVEFENSNEYYIYGKETQSYETLGDLLDEMDYKNRADFGEAKYVFTHDSQKHTVIFEDFNDEIIWTYLFTDLNAKNVYLTNANFKAGENIISFYYKMPEFGAERLTFSIDENNYLITKLFNCDLGFYLGEQKTQDLINYLTENVKATEYIYLNNSKNSVNETNSTNSSAPSTSDFENSFEQGASKLGFSEILSGNVVVAYKVTGFGEENGKQITIPTYYNGKPVTEICDSAFSYNRNIEKVVFEEGSKIEVIGENAFKDCVLLSEVDLGNYNSLIEIGKSAFSGCCELSTFNWGIDCKVEILGDYAFYGSRGLIEFTILHSVTYIGGNCFAGTNITQFVFQNPVGWAYVENNGRVELSYDVVSNAEMVAEYLTAQYSNYSWQRSLSSVLPTQGLVFSQIFNGETLVGYKVVGIDSATDSEICIPAYHLGLPVLEIGENAFSRNNSIEKLCFEEGSRVEKINANAFYSCANLTKVKMPLSLLTICEDAFSYCNKLRSVDLNQGLKTIEANAFNNCVIYKIYLPSSLEKISFEAFSDCLSLIEICNDSNIDFDGQASYYNLVAKNIYSTDSGATRLIENDAFVIYASGDEKVLVYYEGKEAVLDLTGLGLTEISSYAFGYNSVINEVIIEKSVTKIDSFSFYMATNLISISFDNDSQLNYIGEQAFAYTSIQMLVIPEKVGYIGRYLAVNTLPVLEEVVFENPANWYTLNGQTKSFIDSTDLSDSVNAIKYAYSSDDLYRENV